MVPSSQQERIFAWVKGGEMDFAPHLVVIARAGSGKTTTILESCYFVGTKEKVKIFAFNKDIANELVWRLANPTNGRKPLSKSRFKAGTLNAMGESFLRGRAIDQGCMDRFAVDERGERVARIVEGVMRRAGVPADEEVAAQLEGLVSLLKGIMPYVGLGYRAQEVKQVAEKAVEYDLAPPATLAKHGYTDERHASLAIDAICESAKFDGLHDFNDQIFLPVRNGWTKPWYDLVIVDEAQDMNVAQLELAQKTCKEGGRIVLVGDDRQAIYGFRGADSGALRRLKETLLAEEMPLNVTYRCPKAVVELAKQFVPDFEAAPTAPEGLVATLEAARIVEMAQPGDFVLSRVNAPLAKLAYGFIRANKRVRILGRTDLGRGLVKLVEKIQRRVQGGDLATKIENWRRDELNSVDGDDNKAKRQRQLVEDKAETLLFFCEQENGDASAVIRRINALFAGDTDQARQGDFVTCSTIHKIKGKEADNVFVLDKTLFLEHADQSEEENIAYVAYTRAKKTLYRCL